VKKRQAGTQIMQGLPSNSLAFRLIKDGLLAENIAKEATVNAKQQQIPFISFLVQEKLVKPQQIASVVSQDLGLPLLDLSAFDLEAIPTKLLNEKLIRKHLILPLQQKGKYLFVATADPTNQIGLDDFKFNTGLTPQTVLVELDKLNSVIEQILTAQETAALGDLSDTALDQLAISSAEDENTDGISVNADDDAPIVRYVNKIVLDAINKNASDLHFEPFEKSYRIRYRIDGILYNIATPPANLATRITARIKIMSQMDISERRVPQDGRFKMTLSKKRMIDFRVNCCPVANGEKICIRVLDPSNAVLSVEKLGFDPKQKEWFLKAINKPQGMILVTGPTGSGKTITLYTALNILNTEEINISSVEDPVEIHLEGVNQVNINQKAGLNFASALRAFLRQDPDVIMVGEIRDLETAEIAVKAAQTGHLVLSTLHTNSAAETLVRLTNMGIPNYNIATSVVLIIAQRLARRLCEHCKVKVNIPAEALLVEGFTAAEIPNLTLYEAKGCEHCTNGYKGRVGLFEVLFMTEDISNLIMRGGNALELLACARSNGMLTLRESALNKVKQGITSLAEINSVTTD
jgi:type IV pilus assembly protein PilB